MEPSRVLLASAALLLACLAAATPGARAGFQFGGSTAAFKLMNSWIYKLAAEKANAGLYPYIQSNSPDALTGLKSLKFVCAVSHIPYKVAEEQYYDKFTFPLMVSQFSLFTGKPIVPHLTAHQITAIFLGRITNWKQFGKKAKNYAGSGAIQVVGRSDPSGTTWLTTQYMNRTALGIYPAAFVGEGPFKFGRTTVLAKGTAGVTAALKKNPNAIGWVEAAMGYEAKLWEVAIPNGANRWVKARSATVYPVLKKVNLPTNRAFSFAYFPKRFLLSNKDPHSHPIIGLVYGLTRQNYVTSFGPGRYSKDANVVKAFLLWAMSAPGQASGKAYGYVPLPKQYIAANLASINKIVVQGPLPF